MLNKKILNCINQISYSGVTQYENINIAQYMNTAWILNISIANTWWHSEALTVSFYLVNINKKGISVFARFEINDYEIISRSKRLISHMFNVFEELFLNKFVSYNAAIKYKTGNVDINYRSGNKYALYTYRCEIGNTFTYDGYDVSLIEFGIISKFYDENSDVYKKLDKLEKLNPLIDIIHNNYGFYMHSESVSRLDIPKYNLYFRDIKIPRDRKMIQIVADQTRSRSLNKEFSNKNYDYYDYDRFQI